MVKKADKNKFILPIVLITIILLILGYRTLGIIDNPKYIHEETGNIFDYNVISKSNIPFGTWTFTALEPSITFTNPVLFLSTNLEMNLNGQGDTKEFADVISYTTDLNLDSDTLDSLTLDFSHNTITSGCGTQTNAGGTSGNSWIYLVSDSEDILLFTGDTVSSNAQQSVSKRLKIYKDNNDVLLEIVGEGTKVLDIDKTENYNLLIKSTTGNYGCNSDPINERHSLTISNLDVEYSEVPPTKSPNNIILILLIMGGVFLIYKNLK